MKHVDNIFKLDRINRPIGVRAMVLDHFEGSRSLPPPGLRVRVLSPKLGDAESGSNFIYNPFGESQQVIFARSGPEQWPLAGDPVRSCHVIIPVVGYRVN